MLLSYISAKHKEKKYFFSSTTLSHVANACLNLLLQVVDVLHKHQMSQLKEANINYDGGWEGDKRVEERRTGREKRENMVGVWCVLFSRRLHGNRGSSSGISGIRQTWNTSRKGQKTKEKVSAIFM